MSAEIIPSIVGYYVWARAAHGKERTRQRPTAWLGMSDSNSETSSQIIPLKARADFPIRAEFRTWRPLAFELQRRGYAARNWVVPGFSRSRALAASPRRHELPRSLRSEDHRPAAKPATPLLNLRWTSRAKRACVVI